MPSTAEHPYDQSSGKSPAHMHISMAIWAWNQIPATPWHYHNSDEVKTRVGTNIVQPVNSSGKCRIMPAQQILKRQILALINKIELKNQKWFAFSMC